MTTQHLPNLVVVPEFSTLEILKHECWFCPNLGGVLLCLELETGCKKNGSAKPPIILVLIFDVSSSLQILLCHFRSCLLSLETQAQSAFPAGCMFHASFLASCLVLWQAPSLPHLADAVPGPEFLTEGWKFHGPGWGAGISWADLSAAVWHRVHVCSQTRWWKSSCDYRVEVQTAACWLPAGLPHFLIVTISAIWG